MSRFDEQLLSSSYWPVEHTRGEDEGRTPIQEASPSSRPNIFPAVSSILILTGRAASPVVQFFPFHLSFITAIYNDHGSISHFTDSDAELPAQGYHRTSRERISYDEDEYIHSAIGKSSSRNSANTSFTAHS